LDKIENGLSK